MTICKRLLCVMLVLQCLCKGEDVNTQRLEVSKRSPSNYKDFSVQPTEQRARLETFTTHDTFIAPGISKVVTSRRHNNIGWTKTTTDEGKLFVAECPAVPAHEESAVVCVGAFVTQQVAGGEHEDLYWRSELGGGNENSWHVIVVQLYSDDGDPDFNETCLGAGQALAETYSGHKVLIKCGVGASSDPNWISRISELPAKLETLTVPHGHVETFDDLGHGRDIDVDNITVGEGGAEKHNHKEYYGMLEARTTLNKDCITQPAAAPGSDHPPGHLADQFLSFGDYANLFKVFMSDQGRVWLCHCYTADATTAMPQPVAVEVKAHLSPNNPVIGVHDVINFRYFGITARTYWPPSGNILQGF